MSILRQGSLFTLQELLQFETRNRFETVFEAIDIQPIVSILSKKALCGAPTRLNRHAMVYSLFARILDRIPTIKDLVKRLRHDLSFRMACGFTLSDAIPSEASYSRMIERIKTSSVLEKCQEQVIQQAFCEGFITDDTIAIDATHIEARDQAVPEPKSEPTPPKKRGRKTKEEQAEYERKKQQRESQQTLYEKPIEAQVEASLHELRTEVPLAPRWGVKKNSQGKNKYWYGYKGHIAVGSQSQYILQSLLSSGNLHDSKAAIALLKGVTQTLPKLPIRHITMDAGYDQPAIYKQIHKMGSQAVIAYNRRRESEILELDENFAPTCVREHSYRYDSYDSNYQTVKYTRPKECRECPLKNDTLCQKVYKIRIASDLRKYSAPARGTKSWKDIYKKRTAVERVIGYLKEYFQLNQMRHRSGEKAKIHMDLCHLLYNAAKLAVDRMNQKLSKQVA